MGGNSSPSPFSLRKKGSFKSLSFLEGKGIIGNGLKESD